MILSPYGVAAAVFIELAGAAAAGISAEVDADPHSRRLVGLSHSEPWGAPI